MSCHYEMSALSYACSCVLCDLCFALCVLAVIYQHLSCAGKLLFCLTLHSCLAFFLYVSKIPETRQAKAVDELAHSPFNCPEYLRMRHMFAEVSNSFPCNLVVCEYPAMGKMACSILATAFPCSLAKKEHYGYKAEISHMKSSHLPAAHGCFCACYTLYQHNLCCVHR